MAWVQLTFHCDKASSEFISDLLSEAGSAAVTFQDAADTPIFEPEVGTTPLWGQTLVTGLFPANEDMSRILQLIEKAWHNRHADELPPHTLNPLEDKDWTRAWMDDFHPMQFGQRLWIVPSWHEPVDPQAVNILLDPGLAFGTGTHPTTALCLEWLDQHYHGDTDVIDYGCGSGILAIAALKLGANKVFGVDLDPQALEASKDNAEKNGVGEGMSLFLPETFAREKAALKTPLLVANILSGPLVELAPLLAEHVEQGGYIVLSGILKEYADKVNQAYSQWFEMGEIAQKEDWVRLEGRKK